MSAGIPYGLPTDQSLEELARLFGKAPMGAPQSFTGTSGTVVQPEPEAAPAPLSLRIPPRASAPAPAPVAPQVDRGGPVLPDFQPAPLPASEQPARPADMPAPGAVPTSGKFPDPASPQPAAPLSLAPKPAAADEGFDMGGAFKRFTDRGGDDLLIGLGTGLMSTRGFGNGLAAGFQNAQKAEQQRAVTGLAQAELGLKQRKLAQETGALAGNAAIIKRAFPNLSDAEAAAAGSNSGQVSEALKILRDPTHGINTSRVTVGGNIHELKPGQRPSEATLIGPAEAGPEQVEARAAATARGTAAGKPDETFTLIPEAERASLGLPAGSYQRDSKGKVYSINSSGQTINLGGEKSYDAEVGKTYAKQFTDLQTSGRNAGAKLNSLALMEQQMTKPDYYSGIGGEQVKRLNQFLGAIGVKDAKAASPAEVVDALSNQVVLDQLGGSLGAGISDSDRKTIALIGPGIAKTPEGNRQLIGIYRSVAQREQQISQMARDYAKQNGGRIDAGFDDQIAQFANANPLFPTAQSAATAQSDGAAPKAPQGAPQGARQAPDGFWYSPDPNRPGKYLKVQ